MVLKKGYLSRYVFHTVIKWSSLVVDGHHCKLSVWIRFNTCINVKEVAWRTAYIYQQQIKISLAEILFFFIPTRQSQYLGICINVLMIFYIL